MGRIISKELRDTLESHSHVKEVHFNKKGEHFFTAFVDEGKDGKGKKLYSRSTPEFVPKMETKSGQAVQVGTKMAQTWKSEHEIVETLSRKECLDCDVAEVETPEQKLAKELQAQIAKNKELEAQIAATATKGKKQD